MQGVLCVCSLWGDACGHVTRGPRRGGAGAEGSLGPGVVGTLEGGGSERLGGGREGGGDSWGLIAALPLAPLFLRGWGTRWAQGEESSEGRPW